MKRDKQQSLQMVKNNNYNFVSGKTQLFVWKENNVTSSKETQELNPALQDGRRRRNHGAMLTTQHPPLVKENILSILILLIPLRRTQIDRISDWPNDFRSTWTYLFKHTKCTPFVKPRKFGQSEIRSIRCLPSFICLIISWLINIIALRSMCFNLDYSYWAGPLGNLQGYRYLLIF